ncbi:PEP-CTERM sorting domain-containing protein [Sphingomonas sp. CL5.1]|uniref:PEPxxWA-CTERM sorting domain-containing protein n=1 Tax=Sphingomonas sp. CL5.1 TaxID=2653203 RepID=UPI001583795E|nr:PEPxxWA-CTERM sorting domain-containing protein [Sphingomonas sp. CL5.1]QKR98683.1 PEP-CTERM sorting domain-containing protein [Sphingomonas sp. CL5.1]
MFQTFDSYAAGALIGANTYALNSNSGNGAAPAFGSSGNYASVLGGGSYTVNFGATSVFSFVLGSLDTYNTLVLHLQGAPDVTYNGGEIVGYPGLFDSGNQSIPQTNGVVSYNANGGPLIVGATFSSSANSMEFDNLARAVPEPATWALMILGFGVVGGMMRRRRTAVSYSAA